MNKMHILLRQLNLEDELPTLMNATIKKVTVNLDDCYRFFLQSENCIPYDEYIRFEKGLAQFPYPASFEVDVSEQIYLKEEVLKYANLFIKRLIDRMPQYASLQGMPIEYDKDTIVIKVVNEILLKTTSTFSKYLRLELIDAGFNLNVRSEIDQENETYRKVKNDMDTKIEINMPTPIIKEEAKPVVKQPFRRQKNEYTYITLNEVKQDIQYATIRGFIFKTDMTKIKSGKHIQTLWVTDYTDSIIVKRFEGARATLEDLQKVAKGNVFVTVSGEIKYKYWLSFAAALYI